MSKKIICVALLVLTIVCGCSCGASQQEESLNEVSMFVVVEQGNCYQIVYHKDTKVMYAISRGGYNSGNFTIMLNADGTPMVWKR